MDTTSAPDFEKKLRDWMEQGETRFLIDLSGLEYIGSAGLRGILTAAKKLKEKDDQPG